MTHERVFHSDLIYSNIATWNYLMFKKKKSCVGILQGSYMVFKSTYLPENLKMAASEI